MLTPSPERSSEGGETEQNQSQIYQRPDLQLYSFRWVNFEESIKRSYQQLREERIFNDVTISCENSEVEAHKIVLATSSDFFSHLLQRSSFRSNPHPIIFINDVKMKHFKFILDFMYKGEVKVPRNDTSAVLQAAELLEIKGFKADAFKDLNKTKDFQTENFNDQNPVEIAIRKRPATEFSSSSTWSSSEKRSRSDSWSPVPSSSRGFSPCSSSRGSSPIREQPKINLNDSYFLQENAQDYRQEKDNTEDGNQEKDIENRQENTEDDSQEKEKDKDTAEDDSQEKDKDNAEDDSQEKDKDNAEDDNQEKDIENRQDNTEDGNQEKDIENRQENTENDSQEKDKDNAEDGSQEKYKENAEDGNQEKDKENAEDDSQEKDKDNAEDGSQEKDNTEDGSQEKYIENRQENTEDDSQEKDKENAEDDSQEKDKENAEDGSQEKDKEKRQENAEDGSQKKDKEDIQEKDEKLEKDPEDSEENDNDYKPGNANPSVLELSKLSNAVILAKAASISPSPDEKIDRETKRAALVEKVGSGMYKCKQCEYTSKALFNVKKHAEAHLSPRKYKCHLCSSVVKNEFYFKAHMKAKHGIKLKTVKADNEKLKKSQEDSEENNIGDRVEKVNKSVVEPSQLSNGETPREYKCNMCQSVLKNQVYFKAHMKTKHGINLKTVCWQKKE